MTKVAHMPDDPMTTAQAAERLRCSVKTIHRMVEDGRLIASLKLPGETGAYLFEAAEVERVAAEKASA